MILRIASLIIDPQFHIAQLVSSNGGDGSIVLKNSVYEEMRDFAKIGVIENQ